MLVFRRFARRGAPYRSRSLGDGAIALGSATGPTLKFGEERSLFLYDALQDTLAHD